MEERDKSKWEDIHANNQGWETLISQKENSDKRSLSKEESLKLTEMTNAVNALIQQSEAALLKLEAKQAKDLYQKAIEDFHVMEMFVQEIGCSHHKKMCKIRDNIKLLEIAFADIQIHEVDFQSRQRYLNAPGNTTSKLAQRYLRNKNFMERIDQKLKEIETFIAYNIEYDYSNMFDMFKKEIDAYPAQNMTKNKKKLLVKFNLVHDKYCKYIIPKGLDVVQENIYLTVINLLEKANFAYQKYDIDACLVFFKIAEELIPENPDEIGRALRLQIADMRKQV